jgi:hypothetical protein
VSYHYWVDAGYNSISSTGVLANDASFLTLFNANNAIKKGLHFLYGTNYGLAGKLILTPPTKLYGEGIHNTKITCGVAGEISVAAGNGGAVKDMEIEGAGLNATKPAVHSDDIANNAILYNFDLERVYIHGFEGDGVYPWSFKNPEHVLVKEVYCRDDNEVPMWTTGYPAIGRFWNVDYNAGNCIVRDSQLFTRRLGHASDFWKAPACIFVDSQSVTSKDIIGFTFANNHYQSQGGGAHQGYAVHVNVIHDNGGGGHGPRSFDLAGGRIENLRALLTNGGDYGAHGTSIADIDVHDVQMNIAQSSADRPLVWLNANLTFNARVFKNRIIGGDSLFANDGAIDPSYCYFGENRITDATNIIHAIRDYDELAPNRPNLNVFDSGTFVGTGADQIVHHVAGVIPNIVLLTPVAAGTVAVETSVASRAVDHFHATATAGQTVNYFVGHRPRMAGGTWP